MKNERRGGSLTDKLHNGHLDWSGPLGRGSSYSGQMLVGIYSTFLLHFHPDAPLKFIHLVSVRTFLTGSVSPRPHQSMKTSQSLNTFFSICFCLLFYEWNIFEYILFEYIVFFSVMTKQFFSSWFGYAIIFCMIFQVFMYLFVLNCLEIVMTNNALAK